MPLWTIFPSMVSTISFGPPIKHLNDDDVNYCYITHLPTIQLTVPLQSIAWCIYLCDKCVYV